MHLTVRLDAEDLLVGILAHGRVGEPSDSHCQRFGLLIRLTGSDNMTSPGSTFPFSATECGEYLKIFKQLRSTLDYSSAGHRLTYS